LSSKPLIRLLSAVRSLISCARSRLMRRRSSSSGAGGTTIEHTRGSPRRHAANVRSRQTDPNAPMALLVTLGGIGPEIGSPLGLECFCRAFANRRQIGSFVGLAPTPWRSGAIQHEQGIGKAGWPRLRALMIEAAWSWLRYQPDSALSRWFHAKVGDAKGRAKRIAIVALARKLLVALWRFVTQGVVPEGARLKAA
jgi:transposase